MLSRARWAGRRLSAWLAALSVRGALAEAALLALLALGVALTIVWLGRAPQTRLDFPVDNPPAGVTVRGVYGVERNATGAFSSGCARRGRSACHWMRRGVIA